RKMATVREPGGITKAFCVFSLIAALHIWPQLCFPVDPSTGVDFPPCPEPALEGQLLFPAGRVSAAESKRQRKYAVAQGDQRLYLLIHDWQEETDQNLSFLSNIKKMLIYVLGLI
ncbi:hypothetical protein Z043_112926, partial [Scleropages formosus]